MDKLLNPMIEGAWLAQPLLPPPIISTTAYMKRRTVGVPIPSILIRVCAGWSVCLFCLSAPAAEGSPPDAIPGVVIDRGLSERAMSAPPPFFAFENGLGLPPAQLAATLKDLGYDGLSGSGYNVTPLLKELHARGLKLYNTYLTPQFDDGTNALTQPMRKLMDDLQGSETVLWLAVPKVAKEGKAFPKSSPEGDEVALARLRELADYAEPRGVKIALYPHAGFWLEHVEDGLRLANKLNRPSVGATFNLCHWLKVEGDRDPAPVLKAALPRLFFVSLNGADGGDTRKLDWNQLIQTLDRGSYDVSAFMRQLRAIGYTGAVGLQCYNVKGDQKENLQRSMSAWRKITTSQSQSTQK